MVRFSCSLIGPPILPILLLWVRLLGSGQEPFAGTRLCFGSCVVVMIWMDFMVMLWFPFVWGSMTSIDLRFPVSPSMFSTSIYWGVLAGSWLLPDLVPGAGYRVFCLAGSRCCDVLEFRWIAGAGRR